MSVRIPQNAGLLAWLADQTERPPRRIRARRRVSARALRCHPDLVERLESSASGLPGTRLRYLLGFPALIHPDDVVFGVAAGTTWMAFRLPQLGQRAVIASGWGDRGLGPEWVDVDPWLSMLDLHEGTSRVRGWCRAAYARAGELGDARPPPRGQSGPSGR